MTFDLYPKNFNDIKLKNNFLCQSLILFLITVKNTWYKKFHPRSQGVKVPIFLKLSDNNLRCVIYSRLESQNKFLNLFSAEIESVLLQFEPHL